MKTIPLTGLPLAPSALALGVADFGTAVPEELAQRLLDRFHEAGGTFLDTAHIYAAWAPGHWGTSERVLGRWVRSRGVRDRVVVCTKGCHPVLHAQTPRLSEAALAQDLTESLERLQMEVVDLYLLHRDDPRVPVAEVLAWLESHRQAGRIRAYGCSNWSVARQCEMALAATARGATGFAASQVGWSLARSALADTTGALFMDGEMYRHHAATGLPVMAFSSQANGFFSGRYGADGSVASGGKSWLLHRYGTPGNFARLARAEALAAARGATATANQAALAWLLGPHPFPVFPVIGPKSPEQLEDSLGAVDWVLPPAQIRGLSEL